MLGMPSSTPYDLRFRALGIPVRVHPLFWLVSLLLSNSTDPALIGTWVACVFASILVHEYGHGLMARAFGYDAAIVLYSMGGLCYSEGERQSPGQRLAVLFGGPGAGFVLLGVTLAVGYLAYGITLREDLDAILALLGVEGHRGGLLGVFLKLGVSEAKFRVYSDLIYINLFWGLLNLLPIWPLDGGQITRVFLTLADRRHGARRTHIVSMITSALLAAFIATRSNDLFLVLFFGFFAVVNFQQLQRIHEYARYGLDDDDDGWWRR